MVIHRIAVSKDSVGKVLAQKIMQEIEKYDSKLNLPTIKLDTNFGNAPMLKLKESFGYTYWGEVYFRGAANKAFEKVL